MYFAACLVEASRMICGTSWDGRLLQSSLTRPVMSIARPNARILTGYPVEGVIGMRVTRAMTHAMTGLEVPLKPAQPVVPPDWLNCPRS